MKKYKGFNFVELMLVMVVLGVIITLTLPLLKNIKDDDDIHRAYMRKANQDVTDALAMSLIKNRYVRDISRLGKINTNFTNSTYLNAGETTPTALGMRYLFNTAIAGAECGTTSGDIKIKTYEDADCLSNFVFKTEDGSTSVTLTDETPGIVLPGNAVMLFDDSVIDEVNGIYGHIYVDMNGNKAPNTLCKDRYRFILYKDRVALDESITGCTFAL